MWKWFLLKPDKNQWGPEPGHKSEGIERGGLGDSSNALGSKVGQIWRPVRQGEALLKEREESGITFRFLTQTEKKNGLEMLSLGCKTSI